MIPELEAMIEEIDAIKAEGRAVAADLTDTQLNWHPGPDRWSVAECVAHLNVSVRHTLPAFDRAIADARAKGKTAAGPFTYGWFSRWMVGSMEPPPKRRMGTFKIFSLPAGATYRGAELITEFLSVRDQLAERVRQSDGLDLARVRVVSPVNRLLRMPLGAYLAFVITHDRRHLWQARQVRSSSGFGA
jgi:hypothetical protein